MEWRNSTFCSILSMVHGSVLTGGRKTIGSLEQRSGKNPKSFLLRTLSFFQKMMELSIDLNCRSQGTVSQSTAWCLGVLPLVGNSLPSIFLASGDAHQPCSCEGEFVGAARALSISHAFLILDPSSSFWDHLANMCWPGCSRVPLVALQECRLLSKCDGGVLPSK